MSVSERVVLTVYAFAALDEAYAALVEVYSALV